MRKDTKLIGIIFEKNENRYKHASFTMKVKQLLLIAVIAIGSSLLTVAAFNYFNRDSRVVEFGTQPTNVRFANFTGTATPGE